MSDFSPGDTVMTDVVALGELLIDFTLMGTDESGYPLMQAHPGGAPANFLAALSALGAATSLIGMTGTDVFGGLLRQTLKDAGIGTDALIQTPDYFTTLAFVTLDKNGNREFSFARKPGADTGITKSGIPAALIDDTRVFHFGTLSLTHDPAKSATEFAVEYAKAAGKIISFDPNLRPPLWSDLSRARNAMLWGLGKADIVKISDNECDFLFPETDYREAADILTGDFGVKLVYITLGSSGCIFSNGIHKGSVPALSDVHPVDTTGAGDIFGGSAMFRFLQTGKVPGELSMEELEDISSFACRAAGLSTEIPGGIPAALKLKELM